MKISIVIPAKNEEQYLPNLLKSIQEQTLQEKEIIVADAHSRDRTREVAAQFGARVVEGGMPGPGRNLGAKVATGEFIVFFDADIVLPGKTFLQDCLQEFEQRGLDVATCRIQALDGDSLDWVMHGAYNLYTLATEHVLPHAVGFCLFAKRSVHEAINGFDEQVVFAEDHDYARRADKMGFRFGILRGPKIPVSTRRLHKEGRVHTAVKYIYTELYMVTRGSMKRMPFKYDWGKFEKKHDA
jgi:glycosyltransferase involved in cell wall biosynthesis